MRVSLVQAASTEDPAANRERLAELVPEDRDLVVLPEAWARDFGKPGTDVSGDAEALDGPFVAELERVAAQRRSTVVAGMFETSQDPDRPWNTLALRGVASAEYRKIHLYDSFGYRESDRLSPGPTSPVTVDLPQARLGLMTCYDLRFPELARRLVVDGEAQVLAVPAAWVAGERKVEHWRTLLRARAVENTVWVVATGQPAPRYCGHSLVVSPEGDIVAEAGEGEERVDVDVDVSLLDSARRTNPSLDNRRL